MDRLYERGLISIAKSKAKAVVHTKAVRSAAEEGFRRGLTAPCPVANATQDAHEALEASA
jgi:hypothetical protein